MGSEQSNQENPKETVDYTSKSPQLKNNEKLSINIENTPQEVTLQTQNIQNFDPRSPHVGVPRTPYAKK